MPSAANFLRKTRTATPPKAGFFRRQLHSVISLDGVQSPALKRAPVGPDIITRSLGLFGRPLDGNRFLGQFGQGKERHPSSISLNKLRADRTSWLVAALRSETAKAIFLEIFTSHHLSSAPSAASHSTLALFFTE